MTDATALPNGPPSSEPTWTARARALAERFAAVGEALRQAGGALVEQGVPPDYRMVHAVGECHRELSKLRHELSRHAEAAGLTLPAADADIGLAALTHWIDAHLDALNAPPAPPVAPATPPAPARLQEPVAVVPPTPVESPSLPAPEPVASFEPATIEPTPESLAPALPTADAAELVASVETAARESAHQPHEPAPPPEATVEAPEPADEPTRRAALAVLERVLILSTRDGSSFEPLDACLARARELRQATFDAPPGALPEESARVAAGDHPFSGLLKVVDIVEGLNDAEWADLHSQVTLAFGRPLAVAAARGRFVFRA
jgi:hypothetical protein